MTDEEVRRCEYLWPEDFDSNDELDANHQNCCWRKTWRDYDRCIWHAKTDEQKPAKELETVRETAESREKNRESAELLRGSETPAELLDGTYLRGANLTDVGSFTACALRDSVLTDMDLRGVSFTEADLRYTDLNNAYLRLADLSGAILIGADFSDARLLGADLSNANLIGAILSGTYLREASLSTADLGEADLSGAYLQEANLTGVTLQGANLSNADLRESKISNVNLQKANLSGADLREADISHVNFRDACFVRANLQKNSLLKTDLRGTDFSKANLLGVDLPKNLRGVKLSKVGEGHIDNPSLISNEADPNDWNGIALFYHSIVSQCSEYGLRAKARELAIWERRARRKEALASGDSFSWFGSTIAWQITGYGLSVQRVLRNMIVIFGVATLFYLLLGINRNYATAVDVLYYSIITFTTTPLDLPDSNIVKGIVMVEAFLGTLSVVFLGYVLGNREQF